MNGLDWIEDRKERERMSHVKCVNVLMRRKREKGGVVPIMKFLF
jgi:hypothetical protein